MGSKACLTWVQIPALQGNSQSSGLLSHNIPTEY